MTSSRTDQAVLSRSTLPRPEWTLHQLTHRRWFQRLTVWLLLALAWQVAGWAAGPVFLPTFTATAGSFFQDVSNGNLGTLLTSYEQMFVGFGLAVLVGVPVGLIMGVSRIADAVVGVYVSALLVISLEAVIPLLIIIFGTQFEFRVAVVFLFSVVYVVTNTTAGVRAADRRLIEMSRSFCAGRLKTWRSVLLPDALPYVLAGLRLGLANAVKGMIISELWIYFGTGKLMTGLGYNRDLPQFFSMAVWVVLLAAVLTGALQWLQHRLSPWAGDIGIKLRRS